MAPVIYIVKVASESGIGPIEMLHGAVIQIAAAKTPTYAIALIFGFNVFLSDCSIIYLPKLA